MKRSQAILLIAAGAAIVAAHAWHEQDQCDPDRNDQSATECRHGGGSGGHGGSFTSDAGTSHGGFGEAGAAHGGGGGE